MFPRTIIGAVAGYAVYLVATGFSVSSGNSAGASSFIFQRAMVFLDPANFELILTIPTLLGTVAGFCWHLISTDKNQ